MKSKNIGVTIFVLLIISFFIVMIGAISNVAEELGKETITIISSTDNQDLEEIIINYAEQNDINVEIDYAGTLEIMEKLNSGEEYDAVWASNSMWLYMLDSSIKKSDSKIINMNPVVFGIRKSKAEELGFVNKAVKLEDILNAINEGKLKFAMTSATQTNTGACAYLGFLSVLSGNPEILTEEHLQNQTVKNNLINLFKGVNRSSGSEEFLEEMYIDNECDAIVTYETSIIKINQDIKNEDDTLYAIYTEDGVSMSDSVFAYLGETNTNKEEAFLKLQSYLLSNEGQQELMEKGRRVWYGGINGNVDKKIFNPEWGIDTTKYITPIKFPSTEIVKQSLGLYQSELRKPTHIVFALDFSGSMVGTGEEELREAMRYILTVEEASKNYLQFSEKDKITVIPFGSRVGDHTTVFDGTKTENLLTKIENTSCVGSTNLYGAIVKGIEILDTENTDERNVSIVLMTDGMGNVGKYEDVVEAVENADNKIPVYSITFGSADLEQLEEIATLTSGKVFDGKTDLLNAFKIVRGYN